MILRNMKFKIIIFLFFSTICNAQITLNEMMSVLSKDIDNFETFSLKKGFIFKEIIKTNQKDGIAFAKGIGKDTKHIVLYSSYFEVGKKVFFYQTSLETDYLLIKKQLIEQGFKIIDTYDLDGDLYKLYKNNFYTIELKTGILPYPDNIEFYTITIEKNKK